MQTAQRKNWHSETVADTLRSLEVSDQGLSQSEVHSRLETFGYNELPQKAPDPAWKLFLLQFHSPLMYLMILAAFISLFISHLTDTIFIVLVMVSNAVVGFYQEFKANKSLKTLVSYIKLRARVVRDGFEQEVDANTLVPGDIVVLRPGDRVPADGRIIAADNLKLNEANLTGESKPVSKQLDPVKSEAEVGDRISMAFMGTIVEEGSGKIVITDTGTETQYGDIVGLLESTQEEATPLQRMIMSISKVIGVVITIIVGLMVFEGVLLERPVEEVFGSALALFISAIPEGLLPAITIVLSIGMHRIAKHNGLIRRLAATETLGGVTVICTDKTGTLTKGHMEVVQVVTFDTETDFDSAINADKANDVVKQVLEAATSTSDAYLENPNAAISEIIVRGRSTDQAFIKAALKVGINKNKLDKEQQQISGILFSSERKYSASLRRRDTGSHKLFMIGAPERVLTKVGSVRTQDDIWELTDERRQQIQVKIDALLKKGYRLIAAAAVDSSLDDNTKLEEVHLQNLVFLGLIVLNDPVREDVAAAFRQTERAGIRTVIVTGDHQTTALTVAEKVGLKIPESAVLEGSEIENMTDEELEERTKTVAVYARVAPRHKLRIIKAFQAQKEVVAMFGDGVNDAPALKVADIGVAVDKQIDAAREVADILLLDSSFNTIVHAIEEGRIIFNNVRRIFLYLTTQDFSQFCLFFVALLLGLPLPLVASQLLFVNLVESGLPDLALTTENEREGIMDDRPRGSNGIVNKGIIKWMVVSFLISGGIAAGVYSWLISSGVELEKTRTLITMLLCFESLFLALSLRSFKKSIIRRSILSNKWMNAAILLSTLMIVAAVHFEPLGESLKLTPLTAADWLTIIAINIVEIILIDIAKLKFLKKA